MVSSIVYSFEHNAGTKQIQLKYEDQTDPMDCWFYADALERIVYNLVSNALKFTESGGQITIRLSLQDGRLKLTVTDTGIGIAANKLPYIFDRFYQADENSEPQIRK